MLPPPAVAVARALYRSLEVPHYYLPYLLADGRARRPTRLALDMTYRCNLKCAMCPQVRGSKDGEHAARTRRRDEELSTSEIAALARDAARLGVRSFTLTGGEPLVRRDAVEIVRSVKATGMRCSLLTNGTLLHEARARDLVAAGLDTLNVSIDGPGEIHDTIRGRARTFERATAALRDVRDAKKRLRSRLPVVNLVCTIQASNAGALCELVDLARELEANLAFQYLYFTSDDVARATRPLLEGAANPETQDLPGPVKPSRYQDLAREIEQARTKARLAGVFLGVGPDLAPHEIRRWHEDEAFSYVDKCFHPWFAAFVNPAGIVYPCSLQVNMGNIRERPLAEIWNGEAFVGFRRKVKAKRLFPSCAKCCFLNNRVWRYLPAPRGA